MDITGHTRVGDIATFVPVSIAVFERYGVDIYSKGDLPLEEALRGAGMSVGDILAEIERELQAAEEEDRLHAHLASSAPESLADHIREVHHGYLHTHLPRVGQRFVPALLAWGDSCDALFDVAREFDRMRTALLAHLADEEREVFPLVRSLAAETKDRPIKIDAAAVTEVLARAAAQHRAAEEALRTMGDLVDRCASQEGDCPECPELFKDLRALEADVQRHIHLEDDVLFPAIRRLAGV